MFKFYCTQAHTRIQETRNGVFIEDEDASDLVQDKFDFEELDQLDNGSSHLNYNRVHMFLRSNTVNFEIDKDISEPEI